MIDSTPTASGAVVDERPAWSSQLIVEADAGRQAEEAHEDALAESGQRACSVALQAEQVLAGPEDRLDALAERSQMGTRAGLVLACRAHDEDTERRGRGGELTPGIALVTDQHVPAAPGPLEQLERHLAFAAGGIGERERPRRAVGGSQQMEAEAPEPARVAGAVAVAGGLSEGRTLDCLAARGAGHRRRVAEQQLIAAARALAGEDAREPLDGVRQAPAALPVGRLRRQDREEVHEAPAGDGQESAVGGDAHDRLGDAEADEFRVRDATPRIGPCLWQKIVGCAINNGAESVEVGVHRGLRADGVLGTVDFDLSVLLSCDTADPVESII